MNSSRRQFLARSAAGAAAVVAGGTLRPALATPPPAAAATTGRRLTALTGGTVVDVATGRLTRDRTVLLAGDRILAVTRRLPLPPGTVTVDVTGKFVLPGLADLHVHSLGDEHVSPPLYLANGVTTVREMAGNPLVRDWRDRIEAGTLRGPRMAIGSKIIDGDPTLWDPAALTVEVVGDATEARAAVRRAKTEGADFVKVYSRLTPPAYRAVHAEARRLGLTVHGHAPDQVPIEQVSAAGQRSIEHLHALPLATSRREAAVRRMLTGITVATGGYNSWFRQLHPIEWLAATTYSPARADRVFATLRRNGTRVTPTLTMHRVLDQPDLVTGDPGELAYLSEQDRFGYDYAMDNLYKPNRPPEEIARQRQLWAYRQRFARELFAHDVPVLAGTDTGTPYSVPGFALHHELELLVGAGATPRQALYAATVEAARFLGLGRELGSVEAGRLADLVVLDANPLTDIRNTRKVNSVVTRGHVICSAERSQMLESIKRAASQERPGPTVPSSGCCGRGA